MHIFTSPSNFSKVSRKLLSLLTLLIFKTGFALAQDAPFITVWKTDNPGSSEANQITIPGIGTDYLIEWEEVGNEANNNGSETGTDSHTITFPSAGTYRVKISGNFTGIRFPDQGDNEKILDIEQWGDIVWSSLAYAFYKCTNINQTATDVPDLANVTDMSGMFSGANSFNGEIGNWDVSTITNMSLMFSVATSFDGDLSKWDVSNVTDMSAMFQLATSFNSDLSNWNVSNVTSMGYMFTYASSFNVDILNWDVSNVTNMVGMFRNATSFNGDISDWNVSNVTRMGHMFIEASSFNGDLSNWNVSKVTSMSAMFRKTPFFNADISNWNVSNVTDMREMFSQAVSFNQDLGKWNISKVKNIKGMLDRSGLNTYNYDQTLKGWISLDSVPVNLILGADRLRFCSTETTRNILINEKNWSIFGDTKNCEIGFFISQWKTDNAGTSADNQIKIPVIGTDFLIFWQEVDNSDNSGEEIGNSFHTITFPTPGNYRIKIYGNLNRIVFGNQEDRKKLLTIENWGDIQWTSMNTAFAGAENLTISATDTPDLSRVTDMTRMFYDAKSINPDVSHWDVSSVTNMSDLFHGASSFNQDLSNWDISNVTKMTRMFANTDAFNHDLNNWNTENVEEMDFMFWDADAFQGNISEWNTSNVNTMWGMFYSADSFNTDISTWDVSSVTNMTEMFREAVAFNQDISDWNVANVTGISGMFYDASSFDQNLGNWNLSNASSLFEYLTNSGLSNANYDLTLESWATNGNIPSDIALSAEGLNYCASAEYRQQLIDDFGWNIMGDETCSLAIQETLPAAEATSVEKDTEIYLTFDQEIEEIDLSGITLKDISGNTISLTDIYIDGLTLHLVHSGLGSNSYEVIIPESSIISITGKENDAISWSFATQRILSAKEQQKPIDHSAFPNPFSDFTTIQFNLPQVQTVKVLVFDLRGQLVREDQYTNLGSGEQSITFDRKELPAGLYHYQIQSSAGSVGGKMLIE